ncbi:MAG: diacylglycerol kinase family protein [bacterium]|nr:diacylglycerol kinase family protein [bacterium]
MPGLRYYFIMNPGSRGGSSRRKFKKIFEILEEERIDYQYTITTSLPEIYSISRRANEEGYNIITAVGGDGTINEVISGFFKEDGTRISKAKLCVIYTGTSPDFCKSYGIPYKNIEKAMNSLLENKSREIEIGKITFTKERIDLKSGDPVDNLTSPAVRYFACCANIGFGAVLAEYSNSGIRKYLGDFLGTFFSMLRSLISYRSGRYLLKVDGIAQEVYNIHNISIGKTFYIASGIKVRNDLKEMKKHFYILTISNLTFFRIPKIIYGIYSGKQIRNSKIFNLSYGDKVEIAFSPVNSGIEFDGDPHGYLPCRIEPASDNIEIITGG